MKIFSFYAALCAFLCSSVWAFVALDDGDNSPDTAKSLEQYVENARQQGIAFVPVRHRQQVVSARLLMNGAETSFMVTTDHTPQDSNIDVTAEILAAEEKNGIGIPAEPSAALLIKTGD